MTHDQEPEPETLTRLVADCLDGRGLTYRALEDRAVDPVTGYRAGKDTLWKIAHGRDIKVRPEVVRAVAAGLGLPLGRVQAAAAYQYTGHVATPVGPGVAVHTPGARSTALAHETVGRWEKEEAEQGNPEAQS